MTVEQQSIPSSSDGAGWAEALGATFPPGSVTGGPPGDGSPSGGGAGKGGGVIGGTGVGTGGLTGMSASARRRQVAVEGMGTG